MLEPVYDFLILFEFRFLYSAEQKSRKRVGRKQILRDKEVNAESSGGTEFRHRMNRVISKNLLKLIRQMCNFLEV